MCVSISTFTYFRCTTFSDSSSTSSSLDTLTASRVIKDSAVAEVGSRIPCSYMWSRFMNDEFIGKSGEVGGEDAIGRPYGRSGFGRFGERRGFGGFQGHLTCFVLRKLPHYDAKWTKIWVFAGNRDDRGFGSDADYSEWCGRRTINSQTDVFVALGRTLSGFSFDVKYFA